MSQKRKGVYIDSLKGGRDTMDLALTPPRPGKVTDGREIQKLVPAPPVPPAPNQPPPTPKK